MLGSAWPIAKPDPELIINASNLLWNKKQTLYSPLQYKGQMKIAGYKQITLKNFLTFVSTLTSGRTSPLK